MIPHDGGPAFPASITTVHSDEQGKDYPCYEESGMSLRDWFAGQALSSFSTFYAPNMTFTGEGCMKAAELAYALADAMLAARKKEVPRS